MKILSILIVLLFALHALSAQDYSDSISVNFFLLDECRISQSISGEVNYVDSVYNTVPFYFKAYFPSEVKRDEEISGFMKTYKLDIDYTADYDRKATNFYGATVAPEVVVYDERNKKILYKGRIDNSYADVGVRRRVTTSRDLRKVLQLILEGKAIKDPRTKAIGCYLNH